MLSSSGRWAGSAEAPGLPSGSRLEQRLDRGPGISKRLVRRLLAELGGFEFLANGVGELVPVADNRWHDRGVERLEHDLAALGYRLVKIALRGRRVAYRREFPACCNADLDGRP
jgi:hypothetical protein